IPKATNAPLRASSLALSTAWPKAASSSIRWSAASTSMRASGPCALEISMAAMAMAGAVLRPKGSRIKLFVTRISPVTSWYSLSVLKSRSRLVTVSTSLTCGRDAPRSQAFCKKLWPLARRMKGLGWRSRDTGQSLEPDPPHKMTGTSMDLLQIFLQHPLQGVFQSWNWQGSDGGKQFFRAAAQAVHFVAAYKCRVHGH